MFGGEERTIAPSPRRLAEARRAGYRPRSPELTSAAAAFAGIATLCVLGEQLWAAMTEFVQAVWSAPVVRFAATDPGLEFATPLQRIAVLLAVILGVPVVAAVTVAGLQLGLRLRVQFSGGWSLLDPRAGMRRIWSGLSIGSVGGLCVRVLVACLLVGGMLSRQGPVFAGGYAETAAEIGRLLMKLGLLLGAAFVLVGVVDWVVRRRRFVRSLRMTETEAREEAQSSKSARRPRTRRRNRVSANAETIRAEKPSLETALHEASLVTRSADFVMCWGEEGAPGGGSSV
jgi:flagellar biosynthetic protein FlhB